MGNDLAESYLPLRRAASGSSPHGVHIIIDPQGTMRLLTKNYDEPAVIAELDRLLGSI